MHGRQFTVDRQLSIQRNVVVSATNKTFGMILRIGGFNLDSISTCFKRSSA
jgi:hypothetical protein